MHAATGLAANAATTPAEPIAGGLANPGVDSPVWLVGSWTAGGAVFIGGFVAAAVGLIQQPSMIMSYDAALLLGFVGAGAGFLHGSALAYLGRPAGITAGEVMADTLRSAVWMLPAVLLALITAPIIALGPAALRLGQPILIGGTLMAATFGGLICVWSAAQGLRAAKRACDRWADHLWGLPLLFGTLVVLLIAFAATRPAIWWTDVRVTYLGAVVLALGATLWLAIPVEYAGLHFLHRWTKGGEGMLRRHANGRMD